MSKTVKTKNKLKNKVRINKYKFSKNYSSWKYFKGLHRPFTVHIWFPGQTKDTYEKFYLDQAVALLSNKSLIFHQCDLQRMLKDTKRKGKYNCDILRSGAVWKLSVWQTEARIFQVTKGHKVSLSHSPIAANGSEKGVKEKTSITNTPPQLDWVWLVEGNFFRGNSAVVKYLRHM